MRRRCNTITTKYKKILTVNSQEFMRMMVRAELTPKKEQILRLW